MSTALKASGFVVIVGRSNVGKSTLLNALVGTKIAIVTPKPQTTRLPVRGIVNEERGQIVFVDTPGIFPKKDALSQRLNQIVREQLEGVEAVIYVVDPTRAFGPEEANLQQILRQIDLPIITVINKADLPLAQRPSQALCEQVDVGQRMTLNISALKRHDLNRLVDAIFTLLPQGEPYYPELQFTDMGHKEWIEELIREKIFLRLEQELPYTIKTEVTDIQERPKTTTYVSATIWTTEERYKKMVIGAGGQRIRLIGQDARRELEAATGHNVYLDLTVDVDADWQRKFLN